MNNNKSVEYFFSIIKKQIIEKKLSQAYLIEINDFKEVDKFINVLLKELLCPKNSFINSCSDCKVCNLIDINNYPDLKIIDTDGLWIKKEQLTDVKNLFKNKPIFGNKQIYIIKDASKLNLSSGNTILKFLEEPSPNIIAILLTTNRYNVIDTIVSRCQLYSLNQSENLSGDDNLYKIMDIIFDKNINLLYYDELLSLLIDKKTAKEYFFKIERYLFDYVNQKVELMDKLSSLRKEDIFKLILILEKYIERLSYNLNYKLSIDKLIIEINEVI